MNQPCGNTAALNAWEHDNAKAADREDELRDNHPLSDFEAQAWENFCHDGGVDAIEDLTAAIPDVVACALAMFAQHNAHLRYGYGRLHDDNLHQERMKVWRRIEDFMTTEMERLQDEFVDKELDRPSRPEPEDVA